MKRIKKLLGFDSPYKQLVGKAPWAFPTKGVQNDHRFPAQARVLFEVHTPERTHSTFSAVRSGNSVRLFQNPGFSAACYKKSVP